MSHKRTTLQLDNDVAPVLGLVSQYGDSDSEGEPEETYDNENTARSSSHINGSRIEELNPQKGQHGAMDTQLASFLAEIDAIDDSSAPPPPKASEESQEERKAKSRPHSKDKTRSVMLGDMTFVSGGTTRSTEHRKSVDPARPNKDVYLTEPEEPVTVWQHCVDETTQHYYYWNTKNNDVRWDIPLDYSQYLLQHKAYEEALALFKAKKAELGDRAKVKRKDTKVPENDAMSSKAKVRSTTIAKRPDPPKPVIGPGLPPPPKNEESKSDFIGPQIPADRIGHPIAKDTSETVATPEQSRDYKETSVPAMIGPQLPAKEKVVSSSKHPPPKVEDEEEDDFIDDEEIYKKLEEPVFSQYESIIKKNKLDTAPPPPPEIEPDEASDDITDELDDIDKQLDMALEKKQGITMKRKTPMKRKAMIPPTDDDTPNTKLSRISPQDSPGADEEAVSYIKRKLLKNKEQLKLKTEIADLATLVMDKLEFLEITRKGLSKLQVLLIEIQTRIHDWREGGLEIKYLQGKLKDASKQLEHYETSAAPTGWACQWDRMYKRYFYCHKVTGESRWDYPEDDDDGGTLPEKLGPAEAAPVPRRDVPVVEELEPEQEEIPDSPEDHTKQHNEPDLENDESIDGQPLDSLDDLPVEDDADPRSSESIDGKPLIEYSPVPEQLEEPPPPGTVPQGPLPMEVPPPLPPETYSDCESNTSQPDEESPEPPDEDSVGREQGAEAGPSAIDPNTIVAPPVFIKMEQGLSGNGTEEDGLVLSEPAQAASELDTEFYDDNTRPPVSASTSQSLVAQHTEEGSSSLHVKERKKKKEKTKKSSSSTLSMKKRNFPSMVQKWQHAQEDMENEIKKRKLAEQEAEAYSERMAEKWKQEEREKLADNT